MENPKTIKAVWKPTRAAKMISMGNPQTITQCGNKIELKIIIKLIKQIIIQIIITIIKIMIQIMI